MKQLQLTLLSVILTFTAFAQGAFQTALSIPFYAGLTATSVSYCSDGGTILLLSGATVSASGIVVKSDANGTAQWAKSLTYNNANSWLGNRFVGECVGGGFYVFSDLTDGMGNQGYLITTLNAAGIVQWSKAYFANGPYEGTPAIKQLATGEYVVSMGLDQKIASFKTDANGSLLWSAAFREDSVYKEPGIGCAINNDGSLLFVGMDSDGASTSLVKTTSTGSMQWTKVYDNYSTLFTNVYPMATVNTSDGGDLILFSDFYSNGIVSKVDANGNTIWTNKYTAQNGTLFQDLKINSNGNVLLTGADPNGAFSYCEIDQQGNFLSARTWGYTSGFQTNVTSVSPMANGGVAVAGNFTNMNTSMSGVCVCGSNQTGLFSCLNIGSTVTTSTNNAPPELNRTINTVPISISVQNGSISENDINIIQTDFCALTDVTAPTTEAASITAFPSPVASGENLSLNVTGMSGEAMISIYDINGKLVEQNNRTLSNSTIEIPTANFSTGIYLVRLTNEKNELLGTTRFVVR